MNIAQAQAIKQTRQTVESLQVIVAALQARVAAIEAQINQPTTPRAPLRLPKEYQGVRQ